MNSKTHLLSILLLTILSLSIITPLLSNTAIARTGCTLTIPQTQHGYIYDILSEANLTETNYLYSLNDELLLYALVSDDGYMFSHWLVNGETVTDNRLSLLMDNDYTVEAIFVRLSIPILPNTSGIDWPMFMHDPSHTGRTSADDTIANELLWSIQYGTVRFDDAPAIVDNVLYVCAEPARKGDISGYVYAINASTLETLWVFETDRSIRGAPAVVNGVVYVSSDDGFFYALNAVTDDPCGEVLWSYYVGDMSGTSSPVVVDGAVCFVTSLYNETAEEAYGYIYALDATTTNTDGELLWCYSTNELFASFVVDNGVLYTYSETAIYALNVAATDFDGELFWRIPMMYIDDLKVKDGIMYECSNSIIAALNATTLSLEYDDRALWYYDYDFMSFDAIAIGHDVLYLTTTTGRVEAFNTSSRSRLWYFSTGGEFDYNCAPLAVTDNVVYVLTHSGNMFALNATSATFSCEQLWAESINDYFNSAPVISNDVLYLVSTEGRIYAYAANTHVVFSSSGLDDETEWSLTFNGITQTATSDENITFAVCPNGQYTYSIIAPTGLTVSSGLSGSVTIADNDILKEIAFVESNNSPPVQPVQLTPPINNYQITVTSAHGNPTATTMVEAGTSFTAQVSSPELVADGQRWVCIGYSVDGNSSIVSGTSYTFSNVSSVHVILFHWVKQYTVSFIVDPTNAGTVAPLGSQWVNAGALQVSAVADSNYSFDGWTAIGSITFDSVTSALTTASINGPGTVTANFGSASIIAAQTTDNTTCLIAVGGDISAQQISNMTITPYATNTTTVVAFTVTGPSGTTGTGTLTLPKASIPYGTTPVVYIDGQIAANQSYTQDNLNYYITYSTSFSTHTINIVFEQTATPTPTATSTPAPTATLEPTGTATVTPTPSYAATPPFDSVLIVLIAIVILVIVSIAIIVLRRRK